MRTRKLPLALTLLLSSCALFKRAAPPVEEDTSIRFPEFHAQLATMVGESGQPYELDGAMLRALTLAANDFIPPDGRERPCWERQEAFSYRVIRQDNVIFVRISPDPAACEPRTLSLDGGARYAISTDGRILRRLFGGEPDRFDPAVRAAEEQVPAGTPVPNSQVGDTSGERSPELPASGLDAGTPDAG
jgi:hypothetical protein